MSKILIYPNKILRKKTKEIVKIDEQLIKEIDLLSKELAGAENGAGLAAPQIGISKRFFGIKDGEKKVKVFINPKIKAASGERVYPMMVKEKSVDTKSSTETMEDFLEGCLSFPDFFGTVKRWLKIKVEWMELIDKKFVPKVQELTGFEAIVWQHESDHLEGKLFVDYIKLEGGKFYKWVGEKMVEWDVNKVI
ncbi:MAG: peptide deformylase [Candidatus Shapirobacteria bacterium]|nr:peptide deformylase [Candidatus Shapirobacteria bacterium]